MIVTYGGRPVAKLSALDAPDHRLADLVAAGVVRPPTSGVRHRARSRIESKGTVLGAIAGDLITSITLLLSTVLVAVQLADLQFLPRSILRLRLGKRTVQHAVGSVLDTTVFCPRALRSTRSFGEDAVVVVTHLSVLVAVTLSARSLRRSTSSTASTEPNPTLSRSEWNPAR